MTEGEEAVANATTEERHKAYMDGELEIKGKELDDIEARQAELLREFMRTRGQVSRRKLINKYRTDHGMTELEEPAISEYIQPVACNHEFVNIGFSSRKMVCKHCDLEE
jgi:hypothetical protein